MKQTETRALPLPGKRRSKPQKGSKRFLSKPEGIENQLGEYHVVDYVESLPGSFAAVVIDTEQSAKQRLKPGEVLRLFKRACKRLNLEPGEPIETIGMKLSFEMRPAPSLKESIQDATDLDAKAKDVYRAAVRSLCLEWYVVSLREGFRVSPNRTGTGSGEQRNPGREKALADARERRAMLRPLCADDMAKALASRTAARSKTFALKWNPALFIERMPRAEALPLWEEVYLTMANHFREQGRGASAERAMRMLARHRALWTAPVVPITGLHAVRQAPQETTQEPYGPFPLPTTQERYERAILALEREGKTESARQARAMLSRYRVLWQAPYSAQLESAPSAQEVYGPHKCLASALRQSVRTSHDALVMTGLASQR